VTEEWPPPQPTVVVVSAANRSTPLTAQSTSSAGIARTGSSSPASGIDTSVAACGCNTARDARTEPIAAIEDNHARCFGTGDCRSWKRSRTRDGASAPRRGHRPRTDPALSRVRAINPDRTTQRAPAEREIEPLLERHPCIDNDSSNWACCARNQPRYVTTSPAHSWPLTIGRGSPRRRTSNGRNHRPRIREDLRGTLRQSRTAANPRPPQARGDQGAQGPRHGRQGNRGGQDPRDGVLVLLMAICVGVAVGALCALLLRDKEQDQG
jgi:hypothetical protein